MAKKTKGGSVDFTVTASGLNKVDKDAKKAGSSFNQLDKNARSADRAGKGVKVEVVKDSDGVNRG